MLFYQLMNAGSFCKQGRRRYKIVPLTDIDLFDDRYRITFQPQLEGLRTSIKEIGILHPPLLEQGIRYRIISGYKRILVAEELGIREIKAHIYHQGEQQPHVLFLLNLYENLGTRPLNHVEKAIAIHKLTNLCQVATEEVLRNFLPLLGLGSNPKVLEMYLSLIKLEPQVQRLVADEVISVELAHRLAQLSPSERLRYCDLISQLRLGRNRQRQFLEWLDDLKRLQGKSIDSILRDPEIKEILDDEKTSPPEKTDRIQRVLRQRRYPRFTEVEERFLRLRKAMRLPPNVSFNPPPYFEGRRYRLEFTFEDGQEFSRTVEVLKRVDRTLLEQLEHLVE